MSRLKDKIIVVTGGNGLLGRALIKNISKEEGIAINLDINSDHNIDKRSLKCDITSRKSIQSSIKIILKKYKKIDGWVNNAYPRTKDWNNKFDRIKSESWKKNIDIQLNSVFDCCQLVLKVMIKQKKGSIVNISSIYGLLGPNFNVYKGTKMTMPAAYSAIKGGINNFTRYLSSYYGSEGIRVNCVSPGGIFNNQNKTFVKNYTKNVPLQKMALPNDIAPSVSFLLSDESNYITGHNLIIDGGWSIV
ncbi:MAG: short-chain dehydrogenase [Flavobacteriaceae bacterium]|nr:short-chain dehydrogenase [Flavobacteriaceae bacterium]|tara:strand:- start:2593 stop:3333 length:741 start_codon:yes stop_codon:yes gene_type:complete